MFGVFHRYGHLGFLDLVTSGGPPPPTFIWSANFSDYTTGNGLLNLMMFG